MQSPFICPLKSAVTTKPTTQHHQRACPGHLGGGEGLANTGTTLSRAQVSILGSDSIGLLDGLLSLSEDQLNVARVGHVGVDLDWHICQYFRSCLVVFVVGERSESTYTTVGTVSSSALLGSLVDLDVLDDQVASVQTLGIGVGLGVLQELEEELGRLNGPPGAGDTPGLA